MVRSHFLITPLLLFSLAIQSAQPLTVTLKPPRIDDIAVATACNRPRRAEGVNISLQTIDNKTVVHCYGHGGFGFTTLFGSIQEALALLLATNPDKQTLICVIGSGCMGLTMAIELRRHGFDNVSIVTKEVFDITSWRAGGFFDPGTGSESAPEDQHHLKLGLATYHTLQAIEQGNHPYLTQAVVKRMPIYYPADIQCGVEVLEKLNMMPASELVTITFDNGATHHGYKKQMTYFINVTELMKQLWTQILELNIPVVEQEIQDFAQCAEPIICNCSGLGSRKLNNDATIYPARGHFFMLNAQPHEGAGEYMLFTKVVQNTTVPADGKKEYVYFFPKPAFIGADGHEVSCSGMLGGTFIPTSELSAADIEKLDEQEFKKLAERARLFFYGNEHEAQA
jgi:D-amino-acid oxidase